MKKIFFLFILNLIAFSKYQVHYDEWNDKKKELVCFQGEVYSAKSYYKNEKIETCARIYEDFFDIIILSNYYLDSELEFKFDNGDKTTFYNLNDEGESTLKFVNGMDAYFLLQYMKKSNNMYMRSGDKIYKTNLSGFTRDFYKIKNGNNIAHKIGKYGYSSSLYALDAEEAKIINFFSNYFEKTTDKDLLELIDFYYYFTSDFIDLANKSYIISIENLDLMDYLIEEYIGDEKTKSEFREYYLNSRE